MPIASHVILAVTRPVVAPGRIAEKWAANLKNEAEWLNEKRNLVIGSEEAFQSNLAQPGHVGFAPFPSSTFYSRAGLPLEDIENKHLARAKEAYKKYKTSTDRAFAEVDGIYAKRFKEAVDARKDIYSEEMAKRTLSLVGTKFLERGPASIAGLWLTDDPKTMRVLRGSDDLIAGGPFMICSPTKKASLKALLNQRLVQAGIAIINSNYDASVMSRHNQLTAETIQGMVYPPLDLIPFVAGGDSHVDYVMYHSEMFLEIKISKM